MNKPKILCFLFFIYACIPATFTQAAEWRIDPTIRLSTGYNNNTTLTTNEDKPSSMTFSFQPSAKFSRNTETSSLSGTIGANVRRFPEDDERNDEIANLNIIASRRFQYSDFQLGAGFIKDSTLDSELEETGLVFGHTDRIRQSLNPSLTWRFNAKTNLNLNYTFSNVDYATNTQGYVDSQSHTGRFSLRYIVNERSSISLTLNQTLTDNDNDVLSRSTNLQAGYNYKLSKTLSTTLSAGTRKSTVKFTRLFSLANGLFTITQRVKSEDNGQVYNANLVKSTERGSHSFSISQNLNSSISGQLTEATKTSLNNTYHFSSRLSANLGLDYTLSKSINDADSIRSIDREYYTIRSGLNWKLSRRWVVSGNYAFKKQTDDFSGNDAIQNSFSINFRYQWPRFAISR